jgi:hypothetical protein
MSCTLLIVILRIVLHIITMILRMIKILLLLQDFLRIFFKVGYLQIALHTFMIILRRYLNIVQIIFRVKNFSKTFL